MAPDQPRRPPGTPSGGRFSSAARPEPKFELTDRAAAEAWIANALLTRQLQKVQPSMEAAGDLINRARRHLRSARKLAAEDPTLGLSACHDAARQAVTAHLRAAGYRVSSEAGAHRTVVEYATVALTGLMSDADLSALDGLRRDRHTAEYGEFAERSIDENRVMDAIALGERLVSAVSKNLASRHRQGRPAPS